MRSAIMLFAAAARALCPRIKPQPMRRSIIRAATGARQPITVNIRAGLYQVNETLTFGAADGGTGTSHAGTSSTIGIVATDGTSFARVGLVFPCLGPGRPLLRAIAGVFARHSLLSMGGNPIKQVSQSLCADLAFDLSDGELHILAYVAVEYDGGAVRSVALPGLCTLTLLT